MPKVRKLRRKFPWSETLNGEKVAFRLMDEGSAKEVLKFARGLPENQQIYLRMDITKQAVLDEWLENIARGRTYTVLAETAGGIVGYANLHRNEILWTRHLGEIRLLVDNTFSECDPLRQLLVNEVFQIAREIEVQRVVAHIPTGQSSMQRVFENMGFQSEALLRDWLMTADGKMHDLLIVSYYLVEPGA